MKTAITSRWGTMSRARKRSTVLIGIVLAVLAIAAIAIAAIFLRAELTGSAQTGGAVQFEFAIDATGTADGTLPVLWALDADNDGVFDDVTPTFPAGMGATATITNGILDVVLTGDYLPGEGIAVTAPYMSNPSAVDVAVIAWDYGASDLGAIDSGASVEVWFANGGGALGIDLGLPTDVLSGQTVQQGQKLVFMVAPEAPFATSFSFDGTAVVGQTTR